MSQKTFCFVAGLIFLLVTFMHAMRLVLRWDAMIGGWMVPIWVSWVGVLLAGYLAFEGLRKSRSS
jgi:hypothetical protein